MIEEKEKEEEESLDEIDYSLPQDKFTDDEFKLFWDAYKTKLQKKNKPLFNVLDTVNWRIDEKHHVHLIFDSRMMLLEFEKSKEHFVKKARKKLNNYGLMVVSEVSEETQTVNHIKTRKDIYQEFVERNPMVEKLAKQLGLDIENESN